MFLTVSAAVHFPRFCVQLLRHMDYCVKCGQIGVSCLPAFISLIACCANECDVCGVRPAAIRFQTSFGESLLFEEKGEERTCTAGERHWRTALTLCMRAHVAGLPFRMPSIRREPRSVGRERGRGGAAMLAHSLIDLIMEHSRWHRSQMVGVQGDVLKSAVVPHLLSLRSPLNGAAWGQAASRMGNGGRASPNGRFGPISALARYARLSLILPAIL